VRERLSTAERLNRVFPGAGLILAGSITAGLAVGLAFTATASLAIASYGLIPENVPPLARAGLLAAALAWYFCAQVWAAQAVRSRREAERAARRRGVLGRSLAALEQGEARLARELIEPLAAAEPDDLLVACRIAQILTALGDVPGAQAAWERLQRLDRHRLFRRDWEAGLQCLASRSAQGESGRTVET
jgi:hypothetical protein